MSTGTGYRIRSSRLSHQTFDDETVIVDLDTGSYHSLNGVASDVWCLLEDSRSTGQLVTEISRRYTGSVVEMQTQIERFLVELQQAGLVEMADGPWMASTPTPPEQDQFSTVNPPFEVPVLSSYTDMQELLALDPIHEVDEAGWPSTPTGTVYAGI